MTTVNTQPARVSVLSDDYYSFEKTIASYKEKGLHACGLPMRQGNLWRQDFTYHFNTSCIGEHSSSEPVIIEKEVIKEVEVPVEVPVEIEKIVEVPVEVIKEVEVPVEVEKIVEVPAQPILQEKTITENGEYSADEGYDGLRNVVVNVANGVPEDFDEDAWQQYLRWKQVHFTDYMGPESSSIEPDEVYNGCKVTIEIPNDNTTLQMYAVSGRVEWGDGSWQEITEESKDQQAGSNPVTMYDSITHRYDAGIYTLYFSKDFRLLSSSDYNEHSGLSTGSKREQFSWVNSIIKSIGGNVVKDLDFRIDSDSVELEEGIEIIEGYSLSNLGIKNITIPTSVKSISTGAFLNCVNLQTINIPLNGNLNSIEALALYNCPIENLLLPSNVSINSGHYHLNPASSIYVQDGTFNRVKNVKLLDTNPNHYPSDAFINGRLESIYVPYSEDHSVLNAYKTADGWSNYANIIYESDPE